MPMTTYKKIKNELLDKYEIKGFQTLFDYLIVSGIVYLKKDIIEIVRARTPEYVARYKQSSLSRLGLAEKPDTGEIKQEVCTMYDRDLENFNKFCIEENIKKFWIIDILMDEFSKENPVIIDHIRSCQKLNITERKKQVSRLLNDEYVAILNPRDQDQILEMLTKKYDDKEKHLLQYEIFDDLEKSEKRLEEQNDVDSAFAHRIARLKRARMRDVADITEPLIDDET